MWSLIEKYTSYHASEKQKSSNNMKHGAVSCVDNPCCFSHGGH